MSSGYREVKPWECTDSFKERVFVQARILVNTAYKAEEEEPTEEKCTDKGKRSK